MSTMMWKRVMTMQKGRLHWKIELPGWVENPIKRIKIKNVRQMKRGNVYGMIPCNIERSILGDRQKHREAPAV